MEQLEGRSWELAGRRTEAELVGKPQATHWQIGVPWLPPPRDACAASRSPRHTDAHSARADASRADVGAAMEWLKSVHFYRKVPRDLTEATLAGGTISLISSIVMAYLFISNFSAAVLVRSSTCIARPARRRDGRGWPRLGAA